MRRLVIYVHGKEGVVMLRFLCAATFAMYIYD